MKNDPSNKSSTGTAAITTAVGRRLTEMEDFDETDIFKNSRDTILYILYSLDAEITSISYQSPWLAFSSINSELFKILRSIDTQAHVSNNSTSRRF